MAEVIAENGSTDTSATGTRSPGRQWSSEAAHWTVTVKDLGTGEEATLTAGFIWMCQGYYRHGEVLTPDWEGFDRFEGTVVHPQRWPQDLDYRGKRVVVIGSGATAATLIPAIADDAEHVTMLQRSPTFYFVRPNVNELADTLRELDIPDEWTHEIVRRKISRTWTRLRLSFEEPDSLRQFLLDAIRPLLPEGFDVDRHFNPAYRPWQQRIAVLPDGDLFTCIREGQVSVVTDHIDRFTESGIVLESGDTLEADIVITATGFDMTVLGDVQFTVDGEPVDFADTVTYRGVMFTGVPNLLYVVRLLPGQLDAPSRPDQRLRVPAPLPYGRTPGEEGGAALRQEDADMVLGPWVDPENFNPGYLDPLTPPAPQAGRQEPWRLIHEYTRRRTSCRRRPGRRDARLSITEPSAPAPQGFQSPARSATGFKGFISVVGFIGRGRIQAFREEG